LHREIAMLRIACPAVIAGVVLFAAPSAHAAPELTGKVQAALAAWLADRGPDEKVTGIAAYLSFGDAGPAIEAFAGKVGRASDAPPVGPATLFQMGSTSKSFAAAVILKLEAAGTLSLDDTIGKWLPEYAAWKDVTIRRLLNMTSGIPTYSETEFMSRVWTTQPNRVLTATELVRAAYPTGSNDLPVPTGYFYSNTNYVLVGMIAAKAAGKPYRDLVHELIIEPLGLDSTFYEPAAYPAHVIRRLAHGYFENAACTDYQPKDCKTSWNLPLVGRDMRADSLSWAQAAGGAIANARDVDRWVRTIFSGEFVPPKQQAEWLKLVSTTSGKPIADVSAGDPRGFSLGLARSILPQVGAQWFYEGETLGYRTLYVWFADDDMVITVQTNSQPGGPDKLGDAILALYLIVKGHAAGK